MGDCSAIFLIFFIAPVQTETTVMYRHIINKSQVSS